MRRGEQVGYLTKRERIALIRAILASDEADDIAFLTGIDNVTMGSGRSLSLKNVSCFA